MKTYKFETGFFFETLLFFITTISLYGKKNYSLSVICDEMCYLKKTVMCSNK